MGVCVLVVCCLISVSLLSLIFVSKNVPVDFDVRVIDVCSSQSADAIRKDATLSSTQQNFILNLASCLVSMLCNNDSDN